MATHVEEGSGMRKAWIALAIGALFVAGCGGGSEEADDTPAPGASATTAMSGGHAHGGENADCSPSGNTVTVVASGTKFNTDCLAAPANQQFTLSYENKDSPPLRHNIVFLESHTATQAMFRVDIFEGPATKTFSVGPFRAGTYAFHCEVHPNIMQGTFVVK